MPFRISTRARSKGFILQIASCVLLSMPNVTHASAPAPDDAAALYKATCAICHDVP